MSVFMQPIYTQTVGAGGASTIVFNNIPQNFTDLQIVGSARTNYAQTFDDGYIRFGTDGVIDSQNAYSWNVLYGNGSAVASNRVAGYTLLNQITVNGGNATANAFGNFEINVTNYVNGAFKQTTVNYANETAATTSYTGQVAGIWRSSKPITKIEIGNTTSSTFQQYSTFTLYGISQIYDTATPTAPTIGAVTDQAGFASVAFTPTDSGTGQTADSYVVTSTPSGSTTYGYASPIVTPATLGTSYTYQVAARNALGSSNSSASSALTTANSYSSIATYVLANSSTNSVLFTNIPQYYSHLQIRFLSRNTGAVSEATWNCYYNNDSSSNYSGHYFLGNGSVAGVGGGSLSYAYGTSAPGSSSTANAFGAGVLDILDYSATNKFKTTYTLAGYDANGSGLAILYSSNYRSYSPITSILVAAGNGNMAQYSHIALYGIA
jgi:hypothetical protein